MLSAEINTEGCGKTKGCYRHPKGCEERFCSLILTWEKTSDDLIKFELGGDTEGWVAVGFSHDKKMVSSTLTVAAATATAHRIPAHSF